MLFKGMLFIRLLYKQEFINYIYIISISGYAVSMLRDTGVFTGMLCIYIDIIPDFVLASLVLFAKGILDSGSVFVWTKTYS